MYATLNQVCNNIIVMGVIDYTLCLDTRELYYVKRHGLKKNDKIRSRITYRVGGRWTAATDMQLLNYRYGPLT